MTLTVTAWSVMSTGPRALNADDIAPGMIIDTWRPGEPDSMQRGLKLLSTCYVDDGGDLVVDVRHPDGRKSTKLASDLGFCGDRHTGKLRAIAVRAR